MTAPTRPRPRLRAAVAQRPVPTAFTAALAVALAATLAAAVALTAPAVALGVDTTTRTPVDIQGYYDILQPTFSGSPYAVTPSTVAPFSAGSLQAGALQDGLNAINYARYLAGLPADVSLDTSYTSRAQHGAVLLATSAALTHYPLKPSEMTTDFFDTGYSATTRSNIGRGFGTLWSFNLACMSDSDAGNIDRLGHRRWLLNPGMLKTGMGMASANTATYVFDSSRPAGFAYDAIKWPAAGYFPVEVFGSYTPWSITLNPDLYDWTSGRAGHTVTLVRQRDGMSWTFTDADTDKSGEYFNFEEGGYGVANCFIFRPNPASVGSYLNGDVFTVTLSGGITSASTGQPVTISYTTRFMSHAAGSLVPVLPVTSATVGTRTYLGGPKSVKVRRTLKLTGSVLSAAATGRVIVYKQRRVSGKWRGAGSAKVGLASGKYSYRFKPTKRGSWRFYAIYQGATVGTTTYAKSRSSYKGVRVR